MARLQELYKTEIAKALAAKFNHENPMAIPKLTKIVINMGVGKATQDKTLLDSAADSLSKISGQRPVITQGPRCPSRVSGCAKETTSAARSPSAAAGCTSFSIG